MKRFKPGDYAYVSDQGWQKVQIIRASENYYHIKKLDKQSAFGVPRHRLLSTEEYESMITLEKSAEKEAANKPPLLH